MKNKFLALGAAVLLFASCSSDDSDSTIDQSLLLKKWYPTSYIIAGETFPYDDHEECGKDYIEFKTEGVYRDVDVLNCQDDVTVGQWSASGNKVTLITGDETVIGTVIELNAQNLKVTAQKDFGNGVVSVTEIYKATL